MIEELDPGAIKKSREFRAKYPGNCQNIEIVSYNSQHLMTPELFV